MPALVDFKKGSVLPIYLFICESCHLANILRRYI